MAVNAKDFSAAFFHISSLKNANIETTLPRQNNQIYFGFGKNIYISVTKAIAGLQIRALLKLLG